MSLVVEINWRERSGIAFNLSGSFSECLQIFNQIYIHKHINSKCQSNWDNQGPVVQSIVSLTSSLRGQLFKYFTLYNQIHWYFFVEKMRVVFALEKLLTFFQQKYWRISDLNVWNFNKTLTNDVKSDSNKSPIKISNKALRIDQFLLLFFFFLFHRR